MTVIAPPAETGPSDVELRRRAKHLPPLAQGKLKSLEKVDLDRRARAYVTYEQRQKLADRRGELDSEIGSMERHKARGQAWGEDDEERLAELKAERAEVVAELKPAPKPKRDDSREARRKRTLAEEFAVPVLEWYAAQGQNARFEEERADLPKLTKGKTLADALPDFVNQADAVLGELFALENSSLDVETAIAGMKRDVAKIAKEGAPVTAGARSYRERDMSGKRTQGQVKFPSDTFFARDLSNSVRIERGVAYVTWLFREQIEKRLEAEIRAKLEFDSGMCIPEREAKEKELRSKLLGIHRVISRICAELKTEPPIPLHSLAYLEIRRAPSAKPKNKSCIIEGAADPAARVAN